MILLTLVLPTAGLSLAASLLAKSVSLLEPRFRVAGHRETVSVWWPWEGAALHTISGRSHCAGGLEPRVSLLPKVQEDLEGTAPSCHTFPCGDLALQSRLSECL